MITLPVLQNHSDSQGEHAGWSFESQDAVVLQLRQHHRDEHLRVLRTLLDELLHRCGVSRSSTGWVRILHPIYCRRLFRSDDWLFV